MTMTMTQALLSSFLLILCSYILLWLWMEHRAEKRRKEFEQRVNNFKINKDGKL